MSHFSFVNQLGGKWKEGRVQKRSGGHKFSVGPVVKMCGCAGRCILCHSWKERWLVLKDSFLMYIDPATGLVRDVLLMDPTFTVKHSDETNYSTGLVISNLNRFNRLHLEKTTQLFSFEIDVVTSATNVLSENWRWSVAARRKLRVGRKKSK